MRALAPVAALLAASVAGCFLTLGVGDYETAGTGASSGAGGGIGCTIASDCPGQDVACRVRACPDSSCVVKDLPNHTAVADPSPGDCSGVVCDGKGGIVSVPDDTDLPKTADACLLGKCDSGVPSFVPQPAMTQCGTTSATHCDGHGVCIGCTVDHDCGMGDACFSLECNMGKCVKTALNGPCGPPPTCMDGVEVLQNTCKNGFCKTAGNHSCAPYVCDGNACGTSCTDQGDCVTGQACVDHVCGSPLSQGSQCQGDPECNSGHCVDGVCCDMPCSGVCAACSAAAKGSGQDGMCGAAAAGTACGPPACSADSFGVDEQRCDAAMSCATHHADCDGFVCASGACLTSCITATDCRPGYKCPSDQCCMPCATFFANGGNAPLCPGSATVVSTLRTCACPSNCTAECPGFCAGGGSDGSACTDCVGTKCGTAYTACNQDN